MTLMNNELAHHVVLGMKWGIRRYQKKDGKLTPLGKEHLALSKTEKYVRKTSSDVQSIVDSISDKERQELGGIPGTPYLKEQEINDVIKRFMTKVGDTPVAFLDVYKGGKNAGSIGIVTRSGEDYRGKGYASQLVETAKKWLETPEAKDILNIKYLDWFAQRQNEASINLAKNKGFIDRQDYTNDKEWWAGRYFKERK